MSYSCKLCNKKISIGGSDCNGTWQETIRDFFVVKSQVICDTCIDEIYVNCYRQERKGRKHIRYDTIKRNPAYSVYDKFNHEEKCS